MSDGREFLPAKEHLTDQEWVNDLLQKWHLGERRMQEAGSFEKADKLIAAMQSIRSDPNGGVIASMGFFAVLKESDARELLIEYALLGQVLRAILSYGGKVVVGDPQD